MDPWSSNVKPSSPRLQALKKVNVAEGLGKLRTHQVQRSVGEGQAGKEVDPGEEMSELVWRQVTQVKGGYTSEET